jgi:hypothetical protein
MLSDAIATVLPLLWTAFGPNGSLAVVPAHDTKISALAAGHDIIIQHISSFTDESSIMHTHGEIKIYKIDL